MIGATYKVLTQNPLLNVNLKKDSYKDEKFAHYSEFFTYVYRGENTNTRSPRLSANRQPYLLDLCETAVYKISKSCHSISLISAVSDKSNACVL